MGLKSHIESSPSVNQPIRIVSFQSVIGWFFFGCATLTKRTGRVESADEMLREQRRVFSKDRVSEYVGS